MATLQKPLNQAQLNILQLFDRDMTDQQISVLRSKLVDFLDELLQEEVAIVMNEKKLTVDKIKHLSNWDNRTEFLTKIRYPDNESSD
jgi:hypothetical protein